MKRLYTYIIALIILNAAGIRGIQAQEANVGLNGKNVTTAGWLSESAEEPEILCPWYGLQDQIDKADTGDTITLTADINANTASHAQTAALTEADSALTVPAGKQITIDLAGHTINRGLAGKAAVENGNVFTVKAGAELTIKDSSDGKTGKITGGNNLNNGGAIAIAAAGTLNLAGGNIVGNISKDRGGAIFNAGELNISGGAFKENRSRNGGSAIEQQGKMSVKDSFSFDADQYVNLGESSVITKAAAAASSIPVKLADESAGRDILVSGAAQVTAEDAALLNLKLSDRNLSAIYGATAADVRKDAAIELAAAPSIVIRSSGLETGENVIFKVFYKESEGGSFPAEPAYTVSMRQDAAAEYAQRTISRVKPGYYKVVEQGWNWTYTKNNATVAPAEQKTAEGQGKGTGAVAYNQTLTFAFSGNKKSHLGKYAEGTAVNNFRKYDEIVIEISVAAWKDGGEQVLNY